MSMGPSWVATASISGAMLAGSATLACTAMALPPAAWMAATT